MRCLLYALSLAAAWTAASPALAEYRSAIVSQPTAMRHGLSRPWFSQIDLDRGQGRISHMMLHDGALYLQTTRSVIHALDAETGETLWSGQVGRPNHPSLGLGASKDLLATINGSQLYVLNRFNGKLLYQTEVGGAPGAAPALSEKRAYVPMINGLVVAYRLDPLTDPTKELGMVAKNPTEEELAALEETRREDIRIRQDYIPPLSCQGIGRAMVQPVVGQQNTAEEFVAWPTARGYMNISRLDRRREDRFAVKWRLVTGAPISARPAYLPPDPQDPGSSGTLLAASNDGFVYAVRERGGETLWRFSTGEPIIEPAVGIDGRVYVSTQLGGMYAIDVATGQDIWWTPNVARFVAASKERIYVADKAGRLLSLNAETGQRLDSLPLENVPIKLANSQTDRIFLATDTGLVQCLHEIELVEPLLHNEVVKADQQRRIIQQPAAAPEAAGQPAADPFGGAGADPFGGGGAPAAEPQPEAQPEPAPAGQPAGADPFGGGGADPFGGGGADDAKDENKDPFGGGADPFGGGGADPFK